MQSMIFQGTAELIQKRIVHIYQFSVLYSVCVCFYLLGIRTEETGEVC